jgi:putative component of membrane protein insertase Oxa1/YidC/SpoIIIJ protein YidD
MFASLSPRQTALAAIGAYQRYVSPYKGFCCAYRVYTSHASCSALGARVIRRFGVWHGLQMLKQRMRRCGEVHRRCIDSVQRRARAAQRGHCDFDFGMPDADCCDVADCCECGECDWPSRKSRAYKVEPKRKPDKAKRWNAEARRWDESADADAGRRRD